LEAGREVSTTVEENSERSYTELQQAKPSFLNPSLSFNNIQY